MGGSSPGSFPANVFIIGVHEFFSVELTVVEVSKGIARASRLLSTPCHY